MAVDNLSKLNTGNTCTLSWTSSLSSPVYFWGLRGQEVIFQTSADVFTAIISNQPGQIVVVDSNDSQANPLSLGQTERRERRRVSVNWGPSLAADIHSYLLSVDGTTVEELFHDNAILEYEFEAVFSTEGVHTIDVKSVDKTGNISPFSSWRRTVLFLPDQVTQSSIDVIQASPPVSGEVLISWDSVF